MKCNCFFTVPFISSSARIVFIYVIKRIAHSNVPCGIPKCMTCGSFISLFILTIYDLSERYDLHKCSTNAIFERISRKTISNALTRSRSTAIVFLYKFMLLVISVTNLCNTSHVLLFQQFEGNKKFIVIEDDFFRNERIVT